MADERIRISDIAEELGLSTATVSNVIHGKTKKVSDETIKRVQELVEKKGYIPSMAGILLAQNNSRIIGIVVNDHKKYKGHVLEDGFVSASLNALSGEIDRAGYFMMVKATDRWNEIVRFASMWNMEGLVIIGFCEQDYKKLREAMHIPFVIYDGYTVEVPRTCNLIIDNYDGGYQVGKYLKAMGHSKVLCISDNFVCVDSERMNGCAAAMGENAVNFMQIPMEKEERMRFYREWEDEILEYTAVFAVSDFYAVELLHYLQGKGIRVPEDISIVGFDDSPVCEFCHPALTTVKQDVAVRARNAIAILQKLKAGEEERLTVKLPVSLMERMSVKNLRQGGTGEKMERKIVIKDDIVKALKDAGVRPGQTIMVHTSLSSLGFVCGGAQTVIEALMECVSESGTIMMPAQSWKNLDPETGVHWEEPKEWWQTIREHWPAYNKEITPTNTMGAVAEMFRKWPGALRSDHPARSVSAWGRHAEYLTENHDLSNIFGEGSPVGKLYELDGYVLLIGVGYDKNTSLHLADTRAEYPGRHLVTEHSAVMENGERKWKAYQTLHVDGEDFERIGAAFEIRGKTTRVPLGNSSICLMRQRELVDFAVEWIEKNRK